MASKPRFRPTTKKKTWTVGEETGARYDANEIAGFAGLGRPARWRACSGTIGLLWCFSSCCSRCWYAGTVPLRTGTNIVSSALHNTNRVAGGRLPLSLKSPIRRKEGINKENETAREGTFFCVTFWFYNKMESEGAARDQIIILCVTSCSLILESMLLRSVHPSVHVAPDGWASPHFCARIFACWVILLP